MGKRMWAVPRLSVVYCYIRGGHRGGTGHIKGGWYLDIADSYLLLKDVGLMQR